MTKVKVNEGKIYEVTSYVTAEGDEQKYLQYVYATCEQHARQIFESAYDANTIVEISEFDHCISQMYGENANQYANYLNFENYKDEIVNKVIELFKKDTDKLYVHKLVLSSEVCERDRLIERFRHLMANIL